jgi:hypothetical protein
MKKIIEVELKTRVIEPVECKTQMLAVGYFSDKSRMP